MNILYTENGDIQSQFSDHIFRQVTYIYIFITFSGTTEFCIFRNNLLNEAQENKHLPILIVNRRTFKYNRMNNFLQYCGFIASELSIAIFSYQKIS